MDKNLFPTGYKNYADEPGWAINNKAVELAQAGDYAASYQMLLLAEKAGYTGKELQDSIKGIRTLLKDNDLAREIEAKINGTTPAAPETLREQHIAATDAKPPVDKLKTDVSFQDTSTETTFVFPAGYEDWADKSANDIMSEAKNLFEQGDYRIAYHLAYIAEQLGYIFSGQDANTYTESYRDFSSVSEYIETYAAYGSTERIRELAKPPVTQELYAETPAETPFEATETPSKTAAVQWDHAANNTQSTVEVGLVAQQGSDGRWSIIDRDILGTDGVFGTNDEIAINAIDKNGNLHQYTINPYFGETDSEAHFTNAFADASTSPLADEIVILDISNYIQETLGGIDPADKQTIIDGGKVLQEALKGMTDEQRVQHFSEVRDQNPAGTGGPKTVLNP